MFLALLLRKIKFLFKSKNRHGVHSPFVYSLNDKCFNDKTHYKEYDELKMMCPNVAFFLKKKQLRLFFRLLQYLNLKNYAIICKEKKYLSWEKNRKYDLILVTNENLASLEEIIETMQNHSLLIVQNIHKENQNLWKSIQNCQKIHVTIDTYQQGLSFLRKEQRKEHFIIRV